MLSIHHIATEEWLFCPLHGLGGGYIGLNVLFGLLNTPKFADFRKDSWIFCGVPFLCL